jgi:hypothetical protein
VADVKKSADDPAATTDGAEGAGGTGGGSTSAAPEKKPRKDRQTGRKLLAGFNALRTRIATVVWLIAVVCALFLAVGALLVALKMNGANPIVGFVKDGAHVLDLGTFKAFDGKNALVKDRLTNWGIAAVIYLLAGKLLDRLIRP